VVLAKILAVDFFFNEGNQCFDKIWLSFPREITEFSKLFSNHLFPERISIFPFPFRNSPFFQSTVIADSLLTKKGDF
jgi:hypothetical protein